MAKLPQSLGSLVGRRVRRLGRVLYEHRGEIGCDGPLEIEADGCVVLLDGAGDGESLRIVGRPWIDPFEEPLSKENQGYLYEHGKWQRVDHSHREGYADFIGQVVEEMRLLENEHGRVAGLRLSAAGRSLWFAVEGDECLVHWAQPIGFTEPEG